MNVHSQKRDIVRELSGAILVDKAAGSSSYDVIRVLKRHFGFQKIGHSGTLDPLATGLLVVLVGDATRVQDITMSSRKTYQGRIRLGVATTTDDAEGEILVEDPLKEYRRADPEELLRRVRERFSGKILQKPPSFSAIKQGGKKSYELARQGVTPDLAEREVEIYSLSLAFAEEDFLNYEVECSKGFYVRSLARDIGEFLGSRASIDSLRRVSSGRFSVSEAIAQEKLLESSVEELQLVPMSELVRDLPAVQVSKSELDALYQGKQDCLLGRQAAIDATYALRTDDGAYHGLLSGVSTGEGGEGPRLKIRYLLRRTTNS